MMHCRCSYLGWSSWSSTVRCQTGWDICDIGFLGTCRLVCLSRDGVWSPGASCLASYWVLLVMISSMGHRREARLWRSIGKVGTFRLSGHVLHLCRAADGVLPITLYSWGWVLGAWLG